MIIAPNKTVCVNCGGLLGVVKYRVPWVRVFCFWCFIDVYVTVLGFFEGDSVKFRLLKKVLMLLIFDEIFLKKGQFYAGLASKMWQVDRHNS